MSVLVCGGAGYIGSHFVKALIETGDQPVVLDSLKTGHKEAVPRNVPFYQGEIGNDRLVKDILAKEAVTGVVHFAAFSQVSESMRMPLTYYENNFCQTQRFLKALEGSGVRHIIFSSTAAVYGDPGQAAITEDLPKAPINPYGATKAAMEDLIHWYCQATGCRYMALRYFNVAGAHPSGNLGEDHRPETHIIPLAIRAALRGEGFNLFGDDYPTPDGTCIRDYVHVEDLVKAHLLALEALSQGHPSDVYNLGSGQGYSNGEIVQAIRRISGQAFPVTIAPRRPGDPAKLLADSKKIRQDLGWQPQYESIDAIIETALNWHKSHPTGYQPE